MDTEARDHFNFMKKKFKITAKTLHDVIDRYYDDKFPEASEQDVASAEDYFMSENFGYYLMPDGEIKRR
jgi:hypothetical protein